MKHSISVLEHERSLLKRSLSELDETNYQEARKQRDKWLKDVEKAIKILKANK